MKLLMISGDRALASGKKGAFYNTLEEFSKHWDRIDIICPKVISYKFKVSNLFGNVFIHPSPWPVWYQPKWIKKKGLEIYKDHKFNIVTVHEYAPFYNGIGARLLWNKIKVPYVLEIFHIPGHPKTSDFKENLYKVLTRLFIKTDALKAVAVRVMNQNEVPTFLNKAGISYEKIFHATAIYVDKSVFYPKDLPKEYDLIFVGRLEKNKGIDLLLEAIRQLITHNPQLATLIVGTGPLEKSLKLRVKSLKLENQVVFHGWAKDSNEVAKLINESKVLIMPSFNEGGPRVVAEAMACGVPILATPVGIVPDIIKNNESGIIIDWNSKNIAEKAKSVLENQELYQKIKNAGLETARQFDKVIAIKNYADKLKTFAK